MSRIEKNPLIILLILTESFLITFLKIKKIPIFPKPSLPHPKSLACLLQTL